MTPLSSTCNSNELLFTDRTGLKISQTFTFSVRKKFYKRFPANMYPNISRISIGPLRNRANLPDRFSWNQKDVLHKISGFGGYASEGSTVRYVLRCLVHNICMYVCLFGPNLYSECGRRTHAEYRTGLLKYHR